MKVYILHGLRSNANQRMRGKDTENKKSSSSSSAHYSPLLDIIQLLSISLDLRLLEYSSRQPPCVNPHATWHRVTSFTTFTETRSPLQISFTPAVVGSTADMASPLPLEHANMVYYVGDFSSLPDHLVSD
jgi:hypothetical protein